MRVLSIFLIMRKSDKQNGIVICTVVLCFMLTLGLCYAFSGEGFLQAFASKGGGESYFAVAEGGYSDLSLARSSADLIKQRGGAGYVMNVDGIEVIVAVYPDRASAEAVLKKLGGGSTYVKQIDIAAGSFKWREKEYEQTVNSAMSYFKTAFETLYGVSNKLNDGNMGIEDAKMQIRVLYSRIEDLKSDFYKNIADCKDKQVTEIKLALVTALALLDNIDFDGSLNLCVSSVRYQAVQLVLCRQALMNCV